MSRSADERPTWTSSVRSQATLLRSPLTPAPCLPWVRDVAHRPGKASAGQVNVTSSKASPGLPLHVPRDAHGAVSGSSAGARFWAKAVTPSMASSLVMSSRTAGSDAVCLDGAGDAPGLGHELQGDPHRGRGSLRGYGRRGRGASRVCPGGGDLVDQPPFASLSRGGPPAAGDDRATGERSEHDDQLGSLAHEQIRKPSASAAHRVRLSIEESRLASPLMTVIVPVLRRIFNDAPSLRPSTHRPARELGMECTISTRPWSRLDERTVRTRPVPIVVDGRLPSYPLAERYAGATDGPHRLSGWHQRYLHNKTVGQRL
jgi:hypothetical protein